MAVKESPGLSDIFYFVGGQLLAAPLIQTVHSPLLRLTRSEIPSEIFRTPREYKAFYSKLRKEMFRGYPREYWPKVYFSPERLVETFGIRFPKTMSTAMRAQMLEQLKQMIGPGAYSAMAHTLYGKLKSSHVVAHEMGHARALSAVAKLTGNIERGKKLMRLYAAVPFLYYIGAPVFLGLGAYTGDKSKYLIGGLMAAPALVSEAAASILGYRGLSKALQDYPEVVRKAMLRRSLKGFLGGFGTYLTPILGAITAGYLGRKLKDVLT